MQTRIDKSKNCLGGTKGNVLVQSVQIEDANFSKEVARFHRRQHFSVFAIEIVKIIRISGKEL